MSTSVSVLHTNQKIPASNEYRNWYCGALEEFHDEHGNILSEELFIEAVIDFFFYKIPYTNNIPSSMQVYVYIIPGNKEYMLLFKVAEDINIDHDYRKELGESAKNYRLFLNEYDDKTETSLRLWIDRNIVRYSTYRSNNPKEKEGPIFNPDPYNPEINYEDHVESDSNTILDKEDVRKNKGVAPVSPFMTDTNDKILNVIATPKYSENFLPNVSAQQPVCVYPLKSPKHVKAVKKEIVNNTNNGGVVNNVNGNNNCTIEIKNIINHINLDPSFTPHNESYGSMENLYFEQVMFEIGKKNIMMDPSDQTNFIKMLRLVIKKLSDFEEYCLLKSFGEVQVDGAYLENDKFCDTNNKISNLGIYVDEKKKLFEAPPEDIPIVYDLKPELCDVTQRDIDKIFIESVIEKYWNECIHRKDLLAIDTTLLRACIEKDLNTRDRWETIMGCSVKNAKAFSLHLLKYLQNSSRVYYIEVNQNGNIAHDYVRHAILRKNVIFCI
jgi:hypothetical protein